MKRQSSRQLLWHATWNLIVTDDAHGITNVVAEGINRKFMTIKRRAGRYRNIEHFQKPSCSTLADSISTHGNAVWTN